ncbi:ABC-2 type transport system permease protein [Leucobacter luti]|uniref:transporter n=1 Tax=Leucobacter luti TaxID=340320 RepID=UPI0010529D12|nr:transporter [Leucobacter luti]MCW2287392.1 ABC-2 type transport system permease protein [Leucobacter luti]TCK41614.1 ABC-2 type transport system permease protein [Leucobacter luti]
MAESLLSQDVAPVTLSGPLARIRVMVRLRFRVMWNTLTRHPWQLVGAIIGVLYGLGILTMVLIGLVALSVADPAPARIALILAGSALVLGWMIGPILFSGMDRTLDPARLVMFPMRPDTQLAGIAVSGLLGVPGIVTIFAAAATAVTWFRSPLAVAAALLLAPVAAVTCVLASQLLVTAMSRLAGSRRFREVIGAVVLLLLVLIGPLMAGIGAGISGIMNLLPGIAEGLSWTPLGAVWAVPAEIAAGHGLLAVAKLAIALATVPALFAAWRPLYLANIGTVSSGTRATARAGTGWFARFPASPRGAIAARAMTYWLRDPRYLQNILIVIVMPVVLGFASRGSELPIMFTASTVLVAALLPLAIFTDLSYDGTAFSTHVLRGVRGIDDRLGRLWANAIITVPAVLIIAVVTSVIVGRVDQLPTLLGVSGAVMLSGFGIASVSSAIFVMPVPQSGENPFASKPGAGVLSLVGTAGSFGSLFVLTLPTTGLAIAAGITNQPLWVWLTFAVGLLTGGLFCWLGVRLGARIFDRKAPYLLERLSAQG